MNAKSQASQALAPRAVTHIGLTVTDLDQAIAFYENVRCPQVQ
jgi:predicted enzyme related to lactoylglutathione lyase